MKIFITLIISILSAVSTFAQDNVWNKVPNFSCSESESHCFENAKELLQKNYLSFNSSGKPYNDFYFDVHKKIDFLGTSRFLLTPKKSEHVYVLIHGLYGDELQFRSLAIYLHSRGQNVIHFVLPGHGADWKRAPSIQSSEWISELGKMLKLARPLGDKLIVFGQSTGGLLALLAGINDNNKIDGLILMEPAITVQPQKASLACSMKVFVNYAHESTTLAKIAGVDLSNIPKSVSPHMGCEVSKMRPTFLQNLNLSSDIQDFNHVSTQNQIISLEGSKQLGELVKIPTLIFNAPDDAVVKSEDIKVFAQSLISRDLGIYYEYKPGYGHGTFNKYNVVEFNKQIDLYLNQFYNLAEILSLKKKEETQRRNDEREKSLNELIKSLNLKAAKLS
jgi:alpha-beta hydrolase superfamily lysophospholipase